MADGRSVGSRAPARAEERAILLRHTPPYDRPCAIAPGDATLARWFYCDVLGGRQVWPSERTAGRNLGFQVGDAVVAVRLRDRAVVAPIVLMVDDPVELAARCWDAGFTVRVSDAASGRVTVVVTDPFGQRLVLVPGRTTPLADARSQGNLR